MYIHVSTVHIYKYMYVRCHNHEIVQLIWAKDSHNCIWSNSITFTHSIANVCMHRCKQHELLNYYLEGHTPPCKPTTAAQAHWAMFAMVNVLIPLKRQICMPALCPRLGGLLSRSSLKCASHCSTCIYYTGIVCSHTLFTCSVHNMCMCILQIGRYRQHTLHAL